MTGVVAFDMVVVKVFLFAGVATFIVVVAIWLLHRLRRVCHLVWIVIDRCWHVKLTWLLVVTKHSWVHPVVALGHHGNRGVNGRWNHHSRGTHAHFHAWVRHLLLVHRRRRRAGLTFFALALLRAGVLVDGVFLGLEVEIFEVE